MQAGNSATLEILERLLAQARGQEPSGCSGSLDELRGAIAARAVPFFVSGEATIQRNAWLSAVVERPSRTVVLHIDAPPQEELAAFCAATKPAAFGRGMDTVLDPAYRSALALAPSRLQISGWSLVEDNPDILDAIHRLLAPSAARIRAAISKVRRGMVHSHGGSLRSVMTCFPRCAGQCVPPGRLLQGTRGHAAALCKRRRARLWLSRRPPAHSIWGRRAGGATRGARIAAVRAAAA